MVTNFNRRRSHAGDSDAVTATGSSPVHREKLEAAGVEWDPAVSCGGSAFSISSWQPAPQQCSHWGNLLETSSLQQPPPSCSGNTFFPGYQRLPWGHRLCDWVVSKAIKASILQHTYLGFSAVLKEFGKIFPETVSYSHFTQNALRDVYTCCGF